MSKRITSYILILSIMLAVTAFTFPVMAAGGVYAEVIANGKLRNIEWHGSQQGVEYIKKDGQYTFNLTDEKSSVAIDVRDRAIYNHRAAAMRVTVKYYDEGNACFALKYDSYDEIQCSSVIRTSEEVTLTNTMGWKEYVFMLDDAALSNHGVDGLHLYDLAVQKLRGENVFVQSVKIESVDEDYIPDPIMISMTSDSLGHTFDIDLQKFNVNIENISSKDCSMALRASVINSDGECIWYKNLKNADVQSKEKISIEVPFNIRNTGYFGFVIEADVTNSDGRKMVVSNEQKFTVIKKLSPSEQNKRLGVSTHLSGKENKRGLVTATANAGFGMMRDELRWQLAENPQKVFNVPETFANTPEYIKEDSMEPLLILCYGNTLYTDNEYDAPTGDAQVAAFKNYCTFVATKYKGIVKNYEVWNEYNYVEFNTHQEGSEVYIQMLKAANEAVKSVDPDAKIVGVCAGGADENNGIDFMARVFNYGGLPYMDAVSFHPYQWNRQSDMNQLTADLQKVKNLLNQHNSNIPIWITELGWSTGTSEHCISEQDAAISAAQMYPTAIAAGCDKIIWYNLQNTGIGHISGEREHNFGLIRHANAVIPYQAKPAYVAFAAMNRFIGNADYAENKSVDNITIHKFKRQDGTYSATIWSSAEGEISLQLGNGIINAYDMYGERIFSSEKSDGVYILKIGREPVYLCGDLGNMSLTGRKNSVEVSASPSAANGVFNDILDVSYSVSVKNQSDVPVIGMLKMTVRDMNNKIVAEKSEATECNSKGSVTKPFVMAPLAAGNYDVTIEYLTDSKKHASEIKMLSVMAIKNTVNSGITFNDSGFCAEGVTEKPNTEVTILARDIKNNTNAYVNQVTSDRNGIYSVNGKFTPKGMFTVMVYDGELHKADKNFGSDDYEVTLMRGSDVITQISDIKDGDELTAVVNIPDSALGKGGVTLYGVIHGKKELISVKQEHITEKGEYRIPIKIEKARDISSVYFLLWRDNMEPVYGKQTIK